MTTGIGTTSDSSSRARSIDLGTLGAARDHWREEVDRWVVLQLILGAVAFVVALGGGMALASAPSAAEGHSAGDVFALASFEESLARLGAFVNGDGISLSLAILQTVIAIAIALIASRFPALDNVLDAVAITFWSRRLKIASALVAAMAFAMAVASATHLLWALIGCGERCSSASPTSTILLSLSAGVCVGITSASRVTGVDRAGEELLILEMEDLKARLADYGARPAARGCALRRVLPRPSTASQHRWITYAWPYLVGLIALVLSVLSSALTGLSTSWWTAVLTWVAAWVGAQAALALLNFAAQTILQPAWVTYYQTGRGKIVLGFALAVAIGVMLLGTTMSLLLGRSTLDPPRDAWSLLFTAAYLLPGLLTLPTVVPRRLRLDSGNTWGPHHTLEASVLRELDSHLEWLDKEHVRRRMARKQFVEDLTGQPSTADVPTVGEAVRTILRVVTGSGRG